MQSLVLLSALYRSHQNFALSHQTKNTTGQVPASALSLVIKRRMRLNIMHIMYCKILKITPMAYNSHLCTLMRYISTCFNFRLLRVLLLKKLWCCIGRGLKYRDLFFCQLRPPWGTEKLMFVLQQSLS